METRLSVITLAAKNPPLMRDFYSNVLGWEPVAENKDIVFYKLNGFLLSICSEKLLSDFVDVRTPSDGSRSFTLGYNLSQKEDVLELYDRLKNKVNILKPPTEPPFGGLFFYFSDPEGNILEVAYNPFVQLDSNGNAMGHQPIDHL